MGTKISENNHLVLVGKIIGEKKYSHEIYGEKFYTFNVIVPRLSDMTDTIPVTISEVLIKDEYFHDDSVIMIKGQIRSYNIYEGQKNKLVLTVFAKDVIYKEECDDENPWDASWDNISNEVNLEGYICKVPVYRQTPFGREIADLLLAVNRAYNKSDYIPAIAWGRTARLCERLVTGTEVKITGRIQSRPYEKRHEDGTVEKKVAYEVSVASLEIINKESDENNVETKKDSDDADVAAV